MNNFTETTWFVPVINEQIAALMKTYVDYPPRKPQSETYTGPLTLSQYERFQNVREQRAKEGFHIGAGGD